MTGPSAYPERVDLLLAAKRLHRQQMSSEQIAALWMKAIISAKDAELPNISIEGAIRAAYDAGHSAALAFLGAYRLKTSSGQGHHEIAFAAVAALGTPQLDDLVADSSEIRALRSSSLYDPSVATEDERGFAIDWMRRTLPLIRSALVSADSRLQGLLAAYPPP